MYVKGCSNYTTIERTSEETENKKENDFIAELGIAFCKITQIDLSPLFTIS